MDPEALFLSNLPLIEQITRSVAKRHRLSVAEAEDFSSYVQLRLIEEGYASVQKCARAASFSSALTALMERLFAAFQSEGREKWAPSAEAKRLGETAIELERLLHREGFTADEAFQMLMHRGDGSCTRASLEAIYERLPHRRMRPTAVSIDEEHEQGDGEDDAFEVADPHNERRIVSEAIATEVPEEITPAERGAQAEKIRTILQEAISRLDAEDQAIMRLRFVESMTVREIAARLNLDPLRLFRRIEKVMRGLRKALEEQRIDGGDIDTIIDHGDVAEHNLFS